VIAGDAVLVAGAGLAAGATTLCRSALDVLAALVVSPL
jgi:hypothetical protein